MMDKAIIAATNTDVMFECPKCEEAFVYQNDILPTEIPTYHSCEKCKIPLFIAPISIRVGFKRLKKKVRADQDWAVETTKDVKKDLTKTVDVSYDILKSTKKVVMSYGFSATEVDKAISSFDPSGLGLTELIKKTLSSIREKS